MLGQMRVPEALAEIRKVVARPAPRIMNYAEAAAKPRQRPPPRRPLAPLRLGTDTPSSWLKFENHTAEHVITKLRGVVDAREMGVAGPMRKAREKGGVELPLSKMR
ncbi:hypothetical protein EVAR_59905_1 [Eumeta japonica]|uniref:Uncharacterized protein n=1 Tax=Eumeta variegata TaxID=151549 RepID=A0A4C2AHF8_EUMVA|nr:hypothetical protein EVAR_59905_1 [Eumeta japonica]